MDLIDILHQIIIDNGLNICDVKYNPDHNCIIRVKESEDLFILEDYLVVVYLDLIDSIAIKPYFIVDLRDPKSVPALEKYIRSIKKASKRKKK